MIFTTDAFWRVKLVISSPRKKPGLHFFMLDVVASRDITLSRPRFCDHTPLVGNEGFNNVGDQKV